MRRTAATVVTLTLLLAGCSSGSTAAPAPASSTDATATTSTAPVSVSPGVATWASAFCTAAAPLSTLSTLPNPDTTTPASTKTSLTAFYQQGADIFTQTATALGKVGPPPGGGDAQLTQNAVDALSASATQFQGLASKAQAADPGDATAIGSLVSGFSDAIAALQSSFATLNQGQSPEISSAIAAAPECTALAG